MTCAASSPHLRDAESAPAGPLLVLDACEELLQIVLVGPEPEQAAKPGKPGASFELLGSLSLHAPGRAMGLLAPGVAHLLGAAGLKPADLAGIAVARGPGSFTGIRMTLATAAGLAAGSSARMAGLDYLPLLAAGAPFPQDRTVAVATYARSTMVYLQAFGPDQSPLTPLTQPLALDLDRAAQALAGLPGPLLCLGTGFARHPQLVEGLPTDTILADTRHNHADPVVLARAARAAGYAATPPEPLYLRGSDAEDNLARIAQSRGLDPEEARQRLAASLTRPPGS